MEVVFTINLRDAYLKPRTKRTPTAISLIKDYIKRHMKTRDVKLSIKLNAFMWQRSIGKPPRKVKVKCVKDKDVAYVFYFEEEAKLPVKEKQEEKKEKTEKKEEKKIEQKVKEENKKEKKNETKKEEKTKKASKKS